MQTYGRIRKHTLLTDPSFIIAQNAPFVYNGIENKLPAVGLFT